MTNIHRAVLRGRRTTGSRVPSPDFQEEKDFYSIPETTDGEVQIRTVWGWEASSGIQGWERYALSSSFHCFQARPDEVPYIPFTLLASNFLGTRSPGQPQGSLPHC